MPRIVFGLLLLTQVCSALGCATRAVETQLEDSDCVATFSIVAYDPDTESWGIAVQSKVLSVGSIVPWAEAGRGAVATQAWANVAYGPDGLALMGEGVSALETIERLTAGDERAARRQVGVVDRQGVAAAYTGADCNAWAGHRVGEHYCVQGNLLAGPEVIDAMAESYESSEGDFGDRLIAALAAGQAAGGDKRGRQSAALYIVRERGGYAGGNDRFRDVRVDDHVTPIAELARIYALYRRPRR